MSFASLLFQGLLLGCAAGLTASGLADPVVGSTCTGGVFAGFVAVAIEYAQESS